MPFPSSIERGAVKEIAQGVFYIPTLMSNAYMIGEPGHDWLLIDAGVPGTKMWIKHAVEQVYGVNARPRAIILTHGHFDHVGALPDLAEEWDVPVFGHKLELPFLSGKADYPPPDPTVGGFMSQLSRIFSHKGIDLGERVRVLDDNGTVPFLNDWRYVHTPGHTAGHISLFRDRDKVLIAGDAVITVNQDSAADLMSHRRQLRRPPAYLTTNWAQARHSVQKLADLRPETLAAGHGLPIVSSQLPDDLQWFADHFEEQEPKHGRYLDKPAVSDETGLVYVPPAPPDPVGKAVLGVALGASAGLALYMMMSRRGDRSEKKRRAALAPGQPYESAYRR